MQLWIHKYVTQTCMVIINTDLTLTLQQWLSLGEKEEGEDGFGVPGGLHNMFYFLNFKKSLKQMQHKVGI